MPTQNGSLSKRLAMSSEITITATGRKTGQPISLPVWFVWEDGKLYLLPVKGSDTQWYQNVLKTPSMQIEAGGAEGEFQAIPITDTQQVKSVVEKFREKYAGDVKKYYSKLDVAVVAQIQ